ncbi:MAG: hypothetical protein WCP55_24380 [Lentisphaerota bacterium]
MIRPGICSVTLGKQSVSEAEGLSFASVLDTAVALGAPTIRIWAGNCDFGKAD